MKHIRNVLLIVVAVLTCTVLLTGLAAATGEDGEGPEDSTSVSTNVESEGDENSGEGNESDETGSDETGSDETGSDGTDSTDTTTSEVRLESDKPYNGGAMGDWTDTDMDIMVSGTVTKITVSKVPAVKKDIFDLRSLAARLMVLTVVIGLLCLAALIFINSKNRKKGTGEKKKLKTTRNTTRRPRY